MALIVHITPDCRREAEHHSLSEDLDRFAQRVERCQSTTLFDPFPPPYLVKKKFGGRQGRLIAALHARAEHDVIVFLSVMTRGSGDYESQFSRDPVQYGEREFRHRFSLEELDRVVAERTATAAPVKLPDPTEEEVAYLHSVLGSQHGDEAETMVYETEDWISRSSEAPFKNWRSDLLRALLDLPEATASGGTVVPVNNRSWRLLVRKFPQHRCLFLVAPLVSESGTDRDAYASRYRTVLDAEDPPLEEIIRHSRRAYPEIILADDDLWLELQQDPQANLALSPEESEVLAQARRPEGGFPLFINGRAGSGKSTLLQYLFAELLFHHLSTNPSGPSPVYLTCSSELLRNARRLVERLLSCNSRWLQQGNGIAMLKDHRATLENAFREFRPYLLSLVPPNERAKLFAPDHYVGYARFRAMWRDRFARDRAAIREVGPDLSWHVIRSYIKGLSPDDLLDPEEYRQLDLKQITVTQEAFERVYERVWNRWYREKCTNEGLWDEQDLARYVLAHDLINAGHPAVFCDEAQDFTRIDLEIVLRSSLFRERSLTPQQIPHVPFTFAGDPFQTLNPTGFRWDAIRASFVEKFILALDPGRRSRLKDLNYRELTLNYRSSRNIVRFSNFVQALRARLFEIAGLSPQRCWLHEQNSPGVFRFRREDVEFWKRLGTQSDVAILVPCGEGEEIDYVRADPCLRDRIAVEDGVTSPLVLSAGRAKGLEFARVVVYGFGAEAAPDLLKPLTGGDSVATDPDRALPQQYFVNRLYVAVTRAKRRLFIVDSDEGFNRLWKFAEDATLESAILSGIRNGVAEWSEHLARLEVGRPSLLDEDQPSNPLENAAALENEGRATKDAYLLRAAWVAYRNAGRAQEAELCLAEAKFIDGDCLEAGDLFLKNGKLDDAIKAYWAASEKGWVKIVAAAQDVSEINARLECIFAQNLVIPARVDSAIECLQRLASRIGTGNDTERMPLTRGWPTAVNRLIERLDVERIGDASAQRMIPLLEAIEKAGLPVSPNTLAEIYYAAGNFSRAIELWEVGKKTTTSRYRRAKAAIEPFPQKITQLFELDESATIVQECARHPEVVLAPSLATLAGRAHLAINDLAGAERYFDMHPRPDDLLQLANAAIERGDRMQAAQSVAKTLGWAIASGDWEIVLAWIRDTNDEWPQSASRRVRELSASMRRELEVIVVRCLARSELLRDLQWDNPKARFNQRPISEFLRRRFLTKEVYRPDGLPVLEPAAAIELAGNRQDSLLIYEQLRADERLPESDRIEAARRWVACKERQARWESEAGAEGKARVFIQEAEGERRRMGIKPGDFLAAWPDFGALPAFLRALPLAAVGAPTATSIQASGSSAPPVATGQTPKPEPSSPESPSSTTSPVPSGRPAPTPIEVRVPGTAIDARVFVPRRRVLLVHASTGDQSTIDLAPLRFSGDVPFTTAGDSKHTCGVWKLELELISHDRLILRSATLAVGMLVDFASDSTNPSPDGVRGAIQTSGPPSNGRALRN